MRQITKTHDLPGKCIYATEYPYAYVVQVYTDGTFAVFSFTGAYYDVEGMEIVEDLGRRYVPPFSLDEWLKENLSGELYKYLVDIPDDVKALNGSVAK